MVSSGVVVGIDSLCTIFPFSSPIPYTNFVPPASIPQIFIFFTTYLILVYHSLLTYFYGLDKLEYKVMLI